MAGGDDRRRAEIRAALDEVRARLDDPAALDVDGVGAIVSALLDAVQGRNPDSTSAQPAPARDAGSGGTATSAIRGYVHDIRSASGTVLTWAHLVRRGIPQHEAERGMAVVERTVRRQLAVVEQLAAARGAPAEAAGTRPQTTVSGGAGVAASPGDDTSSRGAGEGAQTGALDGIRVLIVDDDAGAREAMHAVLAACGAQVATAVSAIDAFDVLQQGRPDVLISDIVMPDADGYALLRRVRAPDTGERGLIPAIAVTGHTGAEERHRALAAGYQLHLAKPFEPAELIAAVRSLARRPSS